MKPAPFGYSAPASLAEALAVLAEVGEHAKVLAGGQSLLPLLSMRLAAPRHLVDINRVPGLDRVEIVDGSVRVGALVRHTDLERHEGAAAAQPLLRQALRLVGHPTIRNRGTCVGSIAHADPAAELPGVLVVLGGRVEASTAWGSRQVPAAEFFLSPLETALRPGELATSVSFPVAGPRTGTAFVELSRRRGDYALVGVAAVVELAPDTSISSARVGLVSVGPTPLLVDLSEVLVGRPGGARELAAAAALALEHAEPEADIHASAQYRARLVEVLTTRALAQALANASHEEAA